MTGAVRLLHLSDIHFNRSTDGVGFDPDEDIRNEIGRDLRDLLKANSKLDAVIVSGDVAYHGRKLNTTMQRSG